MWIVRNFWTICIMFFYVFFCNLIKVKYFCIVLFIPFAYVSIQSIDCILLSSFKLKAILSVKTLCFSHLNLCCVFKINLLFFRNSFSSFLRLTTLFLVFLLNGLFYFQFELLINNFYNLETEVFF